MYQRRMMNMKRLLAMSDIHGNLNKFEKMIDKINLTKEDRLVIIGDNVDRGKHSIELVFKIKELKDEIETLLLNLFTQRKGESRPADE